MTRPTLPTGGRIATFHHELKLRVWRSDFSTLPFRKRPPRVGRVAAASGVHDGRKAVVQRRAVGMSLAKRA